MDYEKFFKKLETMLKTMSPDEVVAALTDEERLELSKMVTDAKLNKVMGVKEIRCLLSEVKIKGAWSIRSSRFRNCWCVNI